MLRGLINLLARKRPDLPVPLLDIKQFNRALLRAQFEMECG